MHKDKLRNASSGRHGLGSKRGLIQHIEDSQDEKVGKQYWSISLGRQDGIRMSVLPVEHKDWKRRLGAFLLQK